MPQQAVGYHLQAQQQQQQVHAYQQQQQAYAQVGVRTSVYTSPHVTLRHHRAHVVG